MSLTTTGITGADSLINIIDYMAQDSTEANKDARLAKQIHSNKKIQALDNNISQLNEQKKQMSQAAKKGFFGSLISSFIQAAVVALSAIFPAAAPVLKFVGDLLQKTVAATTSKLSNKDQSQAQDAAINAQEFSQIAETEDKKAMTLQDEIQSQKETLKQVQTRLENSIGNFQQSQNAAVRA